MSRTTAGGHVRCDAWSEKVYHYAQNVMMEVGIIAHSCGVDDPRQLDRTHCRVVGNDGLSVPLVKLFPYPAGARAAPASVAAAHADTAMPERMVAHDQDSIQPGPESPVPEK